MASQVKTSHTTLLLHACLFCIKGRVLLIQQKQYAESGMENMDRSRGNNMGKKLDLDCGAPQNPERNLQNGSGVSDRHFPMQADPIPIRIFCSYRRPIHL